jgi:hypothetical protein
MEAAVKISHALRVAGLVGSITILSHTPSYAFDLNGAWTTAVSACGKIFDKNKENKISIRGGSGMYGDAFIVRDNSIVGPGGSCTIEKRKDVGSIHHLVANCAAGNVAISTFQFSFRVKDDNNIVRIFPGIEELDVAYGRCKF